MIALSETCLPWDLVRLPGGEEQPHRDLKDFTPFAIAPILKFSDGTTLREPPAIMEFLADLCPERHLVPRAGTIKRNRHSEWMHFISGEIYGCERRTETADLREPPLLTRLAWIDLHLASHSFLIGEEFSIADIYLWAFWSVASTAVADELGMLNIDRWASRVESRPRVATALMVEG
ncbi:glutathione binding-like protein [Sphingomonas morindae]|uniref:Glutathione S-transferase C-terminal domain-containing protein n=1 Tax=Sphingomonas morindae TaxID=1541170 RepID=A0ABY4XAA7_9SPHN|nr:glutathione binding-like protein [Sphingomonas morindae]USI73885.1 glutathione S-transferase C-terminal domain-containing protein [Sphingomonas morindae]